jgi:hypothetical protein
VPEDDRFASGLAARPGPATMSPDLVEVEEPAESSSVRGL